MSAHTVYDIFMAHKSRVSKIKKKAGPELFEDHLEKKNKKPSKMRNNPITIDEIWFQSQGEGYYYLELKSQLQAGKIRELKRQIPFEFVINGVRIGKYICDFGVMHNDGSLEILDFKSRFTVSLALYQMKKALMLACYQVAIKEVGCK